MIYYQRWDLNIKHQQFSIGNFLQIFRDLIPSTILLRVTDLWCTNHLRWLYNDFLLEKLRNFVLFSQLWTKRPFLEAASMQERYMKPFPKTSRQCRSWSQWIMQVLLMLEILPCLSVAIAAEWGSLQGEQLHCSDSFCPVNDPFLCRLLTQHTTNSLHHP